jgi:hypothetical protein
MLYRSCTRTLVEHRKMKLTTHERFLIIAGAIGIVLVFVLS